MGSCTRGVGLISSLGVQRCFEGNQRKLSSEADIN